MIQEHFGSHLSNTSLRSSDRSSPTKTADLLGTVCRRLSNVCWNSLWIERVSTALVVCFLAILSEHRVKDAGVPNYVENHSESRFIEVQSLASREQNLEKCSHRIIIVKCSTDN